MGHSHSHSDVGTGNETALWWALWLTTGFLIVEVVGGVLTNSLALISDAAHMFTDTAALAIALAAIRIGRRPADSRRTFGYYRFEILAAAVNALLLFGVAVYILFEAYKRLQHPPEIASLGMLIVAAIGLGVNLLSMRLLASGKDSSLNVKGAYLEVWSDMLGSLGVIMAALLIMWTRWAWLDSVVAIAIGLWVLPRTWVLLKQSLNVLLEGVPDGIGLAGVREAITSLPGVAGVHDLHIWSITSGKVSLTVHVVCDVPDGALLALSDSVRTLLTERFHIEHSTVQLERNPCPQAAEPHSFGQSSSSRGGHGHHH